MKLTKTKKRPCRHPVYHGWLNEHGSSPFGFHSRDCWVSSVTFLAKPRTSNVAVVLVLVDAHTHTQAYIQTEVTLLPRLCTLRHVVVLEPSSVIYKTKTLTLSLITRTYIEYQCIQFVFYFFWYEVKKCKADRVKDPPEYTTRHPCRPTDWQLESFPFP